MRSEVRRNEETQEQRSRYPKGDSIQATRAGHGTRAIYTARFGGRRSSVRSIEPECKKCNGQRDENGSKRFEHRELARPRSTNTEGYEKQRTQAADGSGNSRSDCRRETPSRSRCL